MKRAYLVFLSLCLTNPLLLSQSNRFSFVNQAARTVLPVSASQPDPKAQARVLDGYSTLPLRFEANQGQTDARVKFLSRTNSYALFLTEDEAVLTLTGNRAKNTATKMVASSPIKSRLAASADRSTGAVLRMKLCGANPPAKVLGLDEQPGVSNYFMENDPAKWRTHVPTYAKVKYEGIYPGVDLVYYGNQRQLEYDFIVAPGADPHRIAFEIRGAKRIRQDERGDLLLSTGESEIRWHQPVVYQKESGTRQEIAARYAITDKNRVGFQIAKYDASRPLYIDPLIYSTYLGGYGSDLGFAIAVDSAGNAYVTGFTASSDFPTSNPLQPGNAGRYDAFVTKINTEGSTLVYSTFLGGSAGDWGTGIAVDSAGNAYVTGTTYSTDFPTKNPFQAANGGGNVLPGDICPCDAFVTKINPEGSALVYSTYLGGSGNDWGYGIAVDSSGNAYVTGQTYSTDFPTMNPLQPDNAGGDGDAFVAVLNPTGSALVYSTYLGGSGQDSGSGIAVDGADNAYITGQTYSTDFPTMNPLQPANGGGEDAFVAKLSPMGTALVYSTYLGGSGNEQGNGIAVDDLGRAYVTGSTSSSDFPTQNPLQPAYGGGGDNAFVSKLNRKGTGFVYSTYLGGSGVDVGYGIAADSEGNAYITGETTSQNFPTENPLRTYRKGPGDAFVTKLNPSGSALVYSTYLGGDGVDTGYGVAVDGAGNAYVTGWTRSPNFPTTPGAFQRVCGNDSYRWDCHFYGDAFLTKLNVLTATMTTLASSPNPSAYGQAVTFTAAVNSRFGAPPDGETVTFMKGKAVLGTGELSGGSSTFTTSALKVGTSSIKAVYDGDLNFGGSTSWAVKQVVNKAAE